MGLMGTQKTKWLKIRAEITKRPFLALVAGLTKEEINSYFSDGEPPATRLEEIQNILIIDREIKTDRLGSILQRTVGHRGAVRFANKLGVSDATIRNIIDKKYKAPPSYDLLGLIEIYLYYTSDFVLSPEHSGLQKSFVEERVRSLAIEARLVSQKIDWATNEFGRIISHDKKIKRYFGGPHAGRFDKFPLEGAQESIIAAIESLVHIKTELANLIEDFCDFQKTK